jgi:mannonate dehydratase
MARIWQGIDPARLWDCHVHLLGNGGSGSAAWINPRMDSLWHPIERLQKAFYLNAACVTDETANAPSHMTGRTSEASRASVTARGPRLDPIGEAGMDNAFVQRLLMQHKAFPTGGKLMLLAFDWHHDTHGRRVQDLSPFHTPNEYAQRVARAYPDRFEWIASVHPYREDAVSALETAAQGGVRALKWLPAAQGIDPADARCDRFYETLARLKLPLLTHAGQEMAVDGGQMQDYGNPLRLRRALDHGVRVIVAHCASLGDGIDLDCGPDGPPVSNFKLFVRLMDEPRYDRLLYGDLAAVGQRLRAGDTLRTLITRHEWQARLVYGSDYPLPGVMPIFSPRGLAADGFLKEEEAVFLSELRRYNPLLFDFALKRLLAVDGQGFDTAVFASRRVFAGGR